VDSDVPIDRDEANSDLARNEAVTPPPEALVPQQSPDRPPSPLMSPGAKRAAGLRALLHAPMPGEPDASRHVVASRAGGFVPSSAGKPVETSRIIPDMGLGDDENSGSGIASGIEGGNAQSKDWDGDEPPRSRRPAHPQVAPNTIASSDGLAGGKRNVAPSLPSDGSLRSTPSRSGVT